MFIKLFLPLFQLISTLMPAVKELIKTKYASNASSGNANKKSKQLAKCILNVKVGRIVSIGYFSYICWAGREVAGLV